MEIKNGTIFQFDRPRRLKFTMNALCAAEDLGIDVLSIDLTKPKMKDVRGLLYAGLRDDDNEMTPELAGQLATDYTGGLGEIMEAVAKELEAAFGPKKNAVRPQASSKAKQG